MGVGLAGGFALVRYASSCSAARCVDASSGAGCEAGATALSMSDTSASVGSSSSSYPSGCSSSSSYSLVFNTYQGSTATCSSTLQCVCDCGTPCTGADAAPTNGAQVPHSHLRPLLHPHSEILPLSPRAHRVGRQSTALCI